MKKSVIAFIVAFSLSIGFTLLSLAIRASFSIALQSRLAESLSINTLLGIFSSLVGLAGFFVVFYFLANNNKILAVKSTIMAILLGVTLGSAILFLLNIFLYSSYVVIYLNNAVGYAVTSVFQFFLPALTAIMFVELREKKTNSNLTA